MTAAPADQKVAGLRPALAEAIRDARSAWSPRGALAVGAFAVAALAPIAVRSDLRIGDFAAGLYVALAAVGLNFAVGLGGMPSLGQGAFVGVGAFGTALLRAKAGWDPVPAVAVGTAVAVAAGFVVGESAVRLRGAFVAVATWVVSWLFAVTLESFPTLSGGSQGIALPEGAVGSRGLGLEFAMTATIHYELALVLLGLALLAYWAITHGSAGLKLAAVRQGRPSADALGIDGPRLQRGAFVTSAAIGGLVGALWVQLSGVADVSAYGPLLSVELFIAVLLGGAGPTFGPVLGALVLLFIPRAAEGLGSAAGIASERFEPLVASLLLLLVLPFVGSGLAQWLAPLGRQVIPRKHPSPGVPVPTSSSKPGVGVELRATNVSKRFGGVTALDDVTLGLPPAEIQALIGPNGSGKTTLLRILAGAAVPDAGRVTLDSRDLTTAPTAVRVEAGVVRTLQRTTVFPELTALENVMAGMSVRRRDGGAVRSLFSTPQYRLETAAARVRAQQVLEETTLAPVASTPAGELPHGEQRLLMVAMGFASEPKAMLIDEPSAGMSPADLERLTKTLHRIRASGVALLLVEHNLYLVRTVAKTVTVLDAGRILARGTPEEIARNPEVERAYLGAAAE
jgi:branched-chain amino acid transport system permease protein